MNAPADFQFDDGKLRFTGDLTLAKIGDLPSRLDAVDGAQSIDLSEIERIDTVGAWLVHRIVRDQGATVEGANEGTADLLAQVAAADQPIKIRPDSRPSFLRVLDEIGVATIASGRSLLGLVGFFGATVIGLAGLIRHPTRFRYNAMARQFEVVGVQALGIIGLMSFLIGIVIAQQGAVQLRQFGAEVFTINLIGRITMRELGVLMTAIMVAGRSGSAFAAQTRHDEADRGNRCDAHDRRFADGGAGPAAGDRGGHLMMPLLGFYAAMVAIIGGGSSAGSTSAFRRSPSSSASARSCRSPISGSG
jgi:phospholipid/cholesterol/gamma-HCH transport system permease protein